MYQRRRCLGRRNSRDIVLELAVELLLGLGFLRRTTTWASVSTKPSCAILASSTLSVFIAPSSRNQTARTPNGEIDKPCFFSWLETRAWPSQLLIASAAAAASVSRRCRVLEDQLLPADLGKRQLAAFVKQFLEPVELCDQR